MLRRAGELGIVLVLIAAMLPMSVSGPPSAQALLGCAGRTFAPVPEQRPALYVAEASEAGEAHRARAPAPVAASRLARVLDARLAGVLQRDAHGFTVPPAAIFTGRRNE